MKKIIAAMFATFMVLALQAAPHISVEVHNVVASDEQFQIRFVVSGEHSPSSFQWEATDDFQVVWGPQRGSSTSVSIINGKTTRSSETTYTYVLMPKKPGKFTLPAASAVVKGETITSGAVNVEVVESGGGSPSAQQSDGGQTARATGTVEASDLFLQMSVSRNKVVIGEPVTATLKLFKTVNVAGFEDVRFPTFDGFWSQEIKSPTNIEFHREKVGTQIMDVALLRSWTLVPQRAGDLQIEAAGLDCLVSVRNSRSTGSILDSFFQDDYSTIRKRLSTRPVVIKVSSLPAGAPASFCGGVGKFEMSAHLTVDSLKAHDAASLIVKVSGQGNVALVDAPKVKFPPDFEAYDVKTTEGQGSKTFEYPFIPRSAGDFGIGPVEFSYYSPSEGRYVTVRSAVMSIRVAKNDDYAPAQQPGGQLVQGSVSKDVLDLGSDIRYISTRLPDMSSEEGGFFGSWPFWLAVVLIFVAGAGLYVGMWRYEARRADVVSTRRRGATKAARKRLTQAGVYLSGSLYSAFYEELHKALVGYVSDRLSMDISDMTSENIAAALRTQGVSDSLCGEFTDLLKACEFARYSPSQDPDAMSGHYERALSVLSAIEDSMKQYKSGAVVLRSVAIMFAVLLPAGLRAEVNPYVDSLWARGTEAYAAGEWSAAREAWDDIASLGMRSPELFYNLGNACFKDGLPGRAVLNYERALRLKPNYADAKFNLNFVKASLVDRIDEVPEFFFRSWIRIAYKSLPYDAWAVIALVLLALTVSLALMFLRGRSAPVRKAGFFGGLQCLVLVALCVVFASAGRSDSRKADEAVVMRSVAAVKSSPADGSSTDLFVLHEGTKLKILDVVGDWSDIELADGRQGWIRTSDFEVI
ncbi:MAG: BatD family protein [Bacteroidales bacterium]|nr:BatD family protein [Bacteroidales bacterium]